MIFYNKTNPVVQICFNPIKFEYSEKDEKINWKLILVEQIRSTRRRDFIIDNKI